MQNSNFMRCVTLSSVLVIILFFAWPAHAAEAGNLAVDSQTRGNDTYGDWSFQNLEWGPGYPTVNVTVETDESLLNLNGTQRQGLIDNLLAVGSRENDNPVFTSVYDSPLHFGWIVADIGTISITYELSFATRLVDIMLFDVDEGDVARIEIRGADGQIVPPWELELIMEGDLSRYYNNPNRPPLEAATPPAWDDETGTLTARVSWNENRSFTILRPNVPIRQITVVHTGIRAWTDRSVVPNIGSHILTALWAPPRQFKISEFRRKNSDGFQLTWPSLPGRTYEILSSSDLRTWALLATVQGAEPPAVESSSIVPITAESLGQFYKLRIP